MARVIIALTREEVERKIPYRLICETMCGARWDTGRRRRLWRYEFTESERKACSKMKAQAHSWYLKTGVPDEVHMTLGTLGLWERLGNFCASL